MQSITTGSTHLLMHGAAMPSTISLADQGAKPGVCVPRIEDPKRNIEILIAILERTCDDIYNIIIYNNNRENATLKSQVWGSLTLAQ